MSTARPCDKPLYSTLACDPDLAEIVNMFVAEMPDRVANFVTLHQNGQAEELRRAAHQLKGAAGSYGFEPITQAAAQLEDALRAALPETRIHAAVEELIALCSCAREGTGT